MIVPQYWAEARLHKQIQGRQVTVKRFGWSDASTADAQRMADERVATALAAIAAGGKLARREPKRPYNGAEGVPIREEIVHRFGDTIITRNSYGALCLNTPDVLFADVDFVREPSLRLGCVLFLLALIAAAVHAWSIGSWQRFAYLAAALVVVGPFLYIGVRRWVIALQGGATKLAWRSVRGFLKRNPGWRVRLYATPAGIRLLVMHRTFAPDDPEVTAFFKQIHADPMYVRMCQRQHCFRARVSPKPWRIGQSEHLKPRPGVWPIDPGRLPARRRWVEAYENLAARFASCRFVEEFGNAPVHPKAESVRDLHDRLCKTSEDLPLA